MIGPRSRILLESDSFAAPVQVHEFVGREAISQLFDFDFLIVCSEGDELDVEEMLLARVTVIVEADEVEVRRMYGTIAEVRELFAGDRGVYRLRVVPRFWLASLVETLDIFLDMSVPDIIEQKLALIALTPDDGLELRFNEDYSEQEFIVQYKETDLAFLSRLTEHLGISFFFEHGEEKDRLVFTDHNAGFRPISGDDRVEFEPRGEEMSVYQLEATSIIVPKHYVQRDYNYRNPQVELTGTAEVPGQAAGGVIEYGGHFQSEGEAQWMAEVRAQERNAQRRIFEGQSTIARLNAGTRFTVEGHPRGDLELLVTEVVHRAQQSTQHGGAGDEKNYRNEFKAILANTPFRPVRRTPKPRVQGVLTGVVDAEQAGQYAEIDDEGRYKVKFMFDTSGPDEGKASRLVRMMQPHSGAGYGMHFPLRPGIEVLITFVDGDPDRPIIAGTVPNPQTASPVAAENLTQNVIRTGGGNEIAIDDAEDSHRIKMSCPTSSTVFQLGSPNAPEEGAMLATLGASTTVATSGYSAAGAFKSAISLLGDFKSSGDITTVAKKPGAETAFTTVVGIIDALVSAVTATIGVVQAGMDLHEKAKAQAATTAAEAATTAQADCKACRDAAADLLPASKQTEIDALEAQCTACRGGHGQTGCTLTPAQQTELDEAEDYEAKRQAALDYNTRSDEIDDAYGDVVYWQRLTDSAIAAAAEQSTDQRDAAVVENLAVKEETLADKEDAYQAAIDGDPATNAPSQAELLTDATTPYPHGSEFDEYDAKMATCTASDACCGELETKRTESKDANDSYNDLIVAHGPHKDNCNEAKTYLGIWSMVSPLFSVVMFIYTKLKKSQKAVEAIAYWNTGLASGMTSAKPRPPTAAVNFKSVLKSPLHTIGASDTTHVYGNNSVLITGEKAMILGIGQTPGVKAMKPDTEKGQVAIIGQKEVRIASRGEAEMAAKDKLQLSAKEVDMLADSDLKVTAEARLGATPATMTLKASGKLLAQSDKNNIELEAKDAAGEIKLESGAKLTETTKEYKLDASDKAELLAASTLTAAVGSWKMDLGTTYGSLGNGSNELIIDDSSASLKTGGASVELFTAKAAVTSVEVSIEADAVVSIKGAKVDIG